MTTPGEHRIERGLTAILAADVAGTLLTVGTATIPSHSERSACQTVAPEIGHHCGQRRYLHGGREG